MNNREDGYRGDWLKRGDAPLANTALAPDDLILRAGLKRLVPLSDTTIWRMERRGKFPRRIAISDKRVAWRRSEIEAWLEKRAAASLPGFLQRLLEEIAVAEDGAAAVAAVQRYRAELDALPELQREQANELIEDSVNEHRQP